MSTYRKEKNLIIIDLDGVNGSYTLDLNTGILYGVKGSPIKVCPRKREVANLFPSWCKDETNLTYTLYRMFANANRTSEYPNYVDTLLSADKLDSLGCPCYHLYDEQYEYLAKNIKLLNRYLKDILDGAFHYHNFYKWCEWEKTVKSLGSLANDLTSDMYYALTRYNYQHTNEELAVCIYYLTKGKMWEYEEEHLFKLYNYIAKCNLMNKKPLKVNNFMREYVETIKTYNLYKTEYDNKLLAKNYDKHSEAWEFEYGDFKVVIPTTATDIIDEGKNMHHCVGSYVNAVLDNTTYICFIRHKDTPNDCYITCQVHTNGEIGQYFLAYDRHIRTDEDKEFKRAFQNHLTRVWGN